MKKKRDEWVRRKKMEKNKKCEGKEWTRRRKVLRERFTQKMRDNGPEKSMEWRISSKVGQENE